MPTVVIPTHNSAHCVGGCIEAVRACLGDCAVVVADNASGDSTLAVAEAEGGVSIVAGGRNGGFGTAANAGIAAAPTDEVILLNPDVRLASAGRALRGDAAAVDFHGLHAVALGAGSAGAGSIRRERPWWWEGIGQVLAPFWPREMSWRPPALPLGDVWVSGAALALRRSEFLDLGGFDERFFMYSEDRDLSRRYRAAGLPVGLATAIRGVHGHGESSIGSPGHAPARQAWSLLGWVEYVALRDGAGQARLAAALRLRGMGMAIAAIAAGTRHSRRARTDAKVTQMRQVRQYIRRWLDRSLPDSDPLSDDSYYPLAREALARARGGDPAAGVP